MYINFSFIFIFGQCWSNIFAHLTLTVRNLTPTSITSIATPPFPRSMLCVVCYTSKMLHNIDKGDRGCLDMKFCIKWASMYMVIRNEVKVMLFRLSAPRIFDQDCRYTTFWELQRFFCLIEYFMTPVWLLTKYTRLMHVVVAKVALRSTFITPFWTLIPARVLPSFRRNNFFDSFWHSGGWYYRSSWKNLL
jgi:hypothetical protein